MDTRIYSEGVCPPSTSSEFSHSFVHDGDDKGGASPLPHTNTRALRVTKRCSDLPDFLLAEKWLRRYVLAHSVFTGAGLNGLRMRESARAYKETTNSSRSQLLILTHHPKASIQQSNNLQHLQQQSTTLDHQHKLPPQRLQSTLPPILTCIPRSTASVHRPR